MKALMMTALILSAVSFAQAQSPAAAPANHPCVKVREACEAAGFVKGDHKDGKGLHKDCMSKLLQGQSVAGVNAAAADVAACKERKASKGK